MKSAPNKLIHQFSQRLVNEFKSFSRNETSVAYLKVLCICKCVNVVDYSFQGGICSLNKCVWKLLCNCFYVLEDQGQFMKDSRSLWILKPWELLRQIRSWVKLKDTSINLHNGIIVKTTYYPTRVNSSLPFFFFFEGIKITWLFRNKLKFFLDSVFFPRWHNNLRRYLSYNYVLINLILFRK